MINIVQIKQYLILGDIDLIMMISLTTIYYSYFWHSYDLQTNNDLQI